MVVFDHATPAVEQVLLVVLQEGRACVAAGYLRTDADALCG